MKRKQKRADLSPKEANTLDKVCKLQRDNISTSDYWFLTDGRQISLYKQRSGERATEFCNLPKKTFDKFVNWYLRKQ